MTDGRMTEDEEARFRDYTLRSVHDLAGCLISADRAVDSRAEKIVKLQKDLDVERKANERLRKEAADLRGILRKARGHAAHLATALGVDS